MSRARAVNTAGSGSNWDSTRTHALAPLSPFGSSLTPPGDHCTLSKDKGSGGGRVLSYALTAALAGAATGEAQANE
jgi:hypothetical protein